MSPDGAGPKPTGEVWEVILSTAHRYQIQNLATWGFFNGTIKIENAPDTCICVQCSKRFDAVWLCYTYHGEIIRPYTSDPA